MASCSMRTPRADGARRLLPFACVGAFSTALHAALFAALRPCCPALLANLVALVAATMANTELNRRFTFRDRPNSTASVQIRGLLAFAVTYAVTVLGLLLVRAAVPTAGVLLELFALAVFSGIGTVLRFVALNRWVFRPGERKEPWRLGRGNELPGPSHPHFGAVRGNGFRSGWSPRTSTGRGEGSASAPARGSSSHCGVFRGDGRCALAEVGETRPVAHRPSPGGCSVLPGVGEEVLLSGTESAGFTAPAPPGAERAPVAGAERDGEPGHLPPGARTPSATPSTVLSAGASGWSTPGSCPSRRLRGR
ncbi:Putative flippase GtrA (transmembrane translocase of bactoprenol-linked glucose) [Saccharopolyspora kobensis]|uniref:Flippase GtrA (Transmembrane translocase of bactoprenol-linked glucose) n=1 Tax=Saccharopolyspora kobensis TaxID=146035 RepID=A0A1H6DHL7_9PSEU|nr:Putative flippase GtrA (transmembrane translocase of bactoprenol-linked glucose) [Saccharopolyspora kobensis]SFD27270.1 Putative flippase GtrA (transmembrane translocase of bactoprenol-linked glucose) [Saccharopolyspora kobensis]